MIGRSNRIRMMYNVANVIAREHNKKEIRKYMYLSPIFQQQIA
jgi:hypothetical protein